MAARLRARGITTPLAGLAGLLAVPGSASAKLIAITLRTAREVTEFGLANRAVSAAVAALVSHTTRDMVMNMTTKSLATMTLLAVALIGGWFGLPGGANLRATAAPVPEVSKARVPEVPPSAFQLLRNRKVHRELKCTSDQRMTIADHFDDQFEAAANSGPLMVFAPGQPRNPQAEKQQIEAKVKERQDAEAADTKAMAEKMLSPAQLTRLVQIELQIKGAEALLDARVADVLKLTDQQKKTIGEAIDAAQRGGGNAVDGLNTGVSQSVRYWHLDPEQRKAAFAESEKCLTKDQIAEWKKLIGEKATTFDPYTIGGRGGSITSGIQFRGR